MANYLVGPGPTYLMSNTLLVFICNSESHLSHLSTNSAPIIYYVSWRQTKLKEMFTTRWLGWGGYVRGVNGINPVLRHTLISVLSWCKILWKGFDISLWGCRSFRGSHGNVRASTWPTRDSIYNIPRRSSKKGSRSALGRSAPSGACNGRGLGMHYQSLDLLRIDLPFPFEVTVDDVPEKGAQLLDLGQHVRDMHSVLIGIRDFPHWLRKCSSWGLVI